MLLKMLIWMTVSLGYQSMRVLFTRQWWHNDATINKEHLIQKLVAKLQVAGESFSGKKVLVTRVLATRDAPLVAVNPKSNLAALNCPQPLLVWGQVFPNDLNDSLFVRRPPVASCPPLSQKWILTLQG